MSGFKLSENKHAKIDRPLALTVHAVPTPEESVIGDSKRTVRGRWKMLLVLLVCAAPVVASYFTYYVVRPEGRRSFGVLIEPQRPTPDLLAHDLQGRPMPLRELKGQWLLVSVSSGACPAECAENLYLQRQLREGLGKEKERVDRVWLIDDEAPVSPQILPALKQAIVLRVQGSELGKWLEPAAGHRLAEHLYVVDPMGNWMMRFPAPLSAVDATKVRRDLDRLLRASASWDEAGRP